MLYNDINCVNVNNKIEAYTPCKLKNCNFQYIFLNLITSVIDGAKFMKFGRHVVKGHSEGTVSQIFDLGPSFYFMKCRTLNVKN